MQFMKAMLGSSVFTLLLSWDVLKRMTVLTPSSPFDNVLLEWTLAVELHGCLGIKVLESKEVFEKYSQPQQLVASFSYG